MGNVTRRCSRQRNRRDSGAAGQPGATLLGTTLGCPTVPPFRCPAVIIFHTMPFTLPPARLEAARAFAATFHPGQRVCLTTHVNPDGDGLGSEAGLAHLLKSLGVDVVVTNPTPTP